MSNRSRNVLIAWGIIGFFAIIIYTGVNLFDYSFALFGLLVFPVLIKILGEKPKEKN